MVHRGPRRACGGALPDTRPPLVMPQSSSSDPSTLPSWASMHGPSEQTCGDLFQNCNLFQRGQRPHSLAPAHRLQMHCTALIFSKTRAFPMQHTLCGKPCFLLTSGTNSVWHVWRDCFPFEPLPCCDYSVPPGSPPTNSAAPSRPGFLLGGGEGERVREDGASPPLGGPGLAPGASMSQLRPESK